MQVEAFLEGLALSKLGRAAALNWIRVLAGPAGDMGGHLQRARAWLLLQLNDSLSAAVALPPGCSQQQRGCPEVRLHVN